MFSAINSLCSVRQLRHEIVGFSEVFRNKIKIKCGVTDKVA
jgi:hypothetical protein